MGSGSQRRHGGSVLKYRAPWGRGLQKEGVENTTSLTSRRRLQWYRCWTKAASRAGHSVLRGRALGKSRLSSAPGSRLFGGLREKGGQPPQEHTSPCGQQFIFIKVSPPPPRMEEQTIHRQQTMGKWVSSRRTSRRRKRLRPAGVSGGLQGSSVFSHLQLQLLGPPGPPGLGWLGVGLQVGWSM